MQLRSVQWALSKFKKQESGVENEEEQKEKAVIQFILGKFKKEPDDREKKGRSVSVDLAMLKQQTKRWRRKFSKKSNENETREETEDVRSVPQEEDIIFDEDDSDEDAQCNPTLENLKTSEREESIWGCTSTSRNVEGSTFTPLESLEDRSEAQVIKITLDYCDTYVDLIARVEKPIYLGF